MSCIIIPQYGSLDRKSVANVIDNATTVKVYINLSQYKIGSHNNPCSLEALGIVPKRFDKYSFNR